jgi:hypothetical protein
LEGTTLSYKTQTKPERTRAPTLWYSPWAGQAVRVVRAGISSRVSPAATSYEHRERPSSRRFDENWPSSVCPSQECFGSRSTALIGREAAHRPRALAKTLRKKQHVHRPPAAICTCCSPAPGACDSGLKLRGAPAKHVHTLARVPRQNILQVDAESAK